jgi:hypothetical protein
MVVKLIISLNDIMHIYPELYIYIVKWLDYGVSFVSFAPHHSKYSGASGKRMEYSTQRKDKEGGP